MTQEDQSFSVEKSLVRSDSDLLLMNLVELVNIASLEISITLFVQGAIITGMLIGEKPYFEALNNELKSTGFVPDEAINTFIQKFNFSSTNSSDNLEEQDQPINREFIHIKNANFFSSSSFVSATRELYWRGRLSRIDGFFLGN